MAIAVDVDQKTVTLGFYVLASAGAAGSTASRSILGPPAASPPPSITAARQIGASLIDVTRADDGRTTEYFTRSYIQPTNVYALYDRAYPAGDFTAKAVLPGYTFTPIVANLTAAPGALIEQDLP